MSFGIKQTTKNKSWTELLVEESDRSFRDRGARRSWTFRRMYMTVLNTFFALFCVYCSFFYIGAFVDVGKIVGVSQAQKAATAKSNIATIPAETDRTILSPFSDALLVKRIYMLQGQSIMATYSLPAKSSITLRVKQCNNIPIVEVFQCKFVGEQEKIVRDKTAGFVKFTAEAPGFYYFENTAIKFPSTELRVNHNYKIIWQRT